MPHTPIIIGIAGASASGKSLLANTLARELGEHSVAVISEDNYYMNFNDLSFEQRQALNYDHPDSLDHELLSEHLKTLRKNQPIEIPIHDYATYLRLPNTKSTKPRRIVILEGNLIFCDANVRNLIDICIFMDTPLDICLMRRLKRDMLERERDLQSVLKQYESTVRPMYYEFIQPSRHYADIIVPRGGENRIAIELIQAKIRELLNQTDTTEVLI